MGFARREFGKVDRPPKGMSCPCQPVVKAHPEHKYPLAIISLPVKWICKTPVVGLGYPCHHLQTWFECLHANSFSAIWFNPPARDCSCDERDHPLWLLQQIWLDFSCPHLILSRPSQYPFEYSRNALPAFWRREKGLVLIVQLWFTYELRWLSSCAWAVSQAMYGTWNARV